MGNEATRRRRQKGRAPARYVGIPDYVYRSAEFADLDGWAIKLLVELAGRYNGYNNGDLSCAWSDLTSRGWKSKGTLWKALKRLQTGGWIITTRHGSRNRCALYAITWAAVDECPDKGLEVRPTKAAPNSWQKNKNAARNTYQCARNAYSNGAEAA